MNRLHNNLLSNSISVRHSLGFIDWQWHEKKEAGSWTLILYCHILSVIMFLVVVYPLPPCIMCLLDATRTLSTKHL